MKRVIFKGMSMPRIEPVILSQSQRDMVDRLAARTHLQRTGRGGAATVSAIDSEALKDCNKNVIQALKAKGVLRPFRNGYRLMLESIQSNKPN